DFAHEDLVAAGMRLGAAYMRGEEEKPAAVLAARAKTEEPFVRRGVVKTLLRNVLLPKDKLQQEQGERALAGLAILAGRASDLAAVLAEVRMILGHYLKTRDQMRQQLEDAFAMQLEQMEAAVAQQTGFRVRLDPGQHPKFQEEWNRMRSSLDDQYGRALEQHRQLLEQRLAGRG
ncbi:MAG: DUF6657 family protein, partial [Thermodesulfobacteriota bacterium]